MTQRFNKIGIVGTGLMGTGIAEVAALAGMDTVLVKATAGDPAPAVARIDKSMRRRVERGNLDADAAAAALARIEATAELTDLAGCDLIIESIVEDLPTKQALFSRLVEVCPGATLASNTSTLKIADLAPAGAGEASASGAVSSTVSSGSGVASDSFSSVGWGALKLKLLIVRRG